MKATPLLGDTLLISPIVHSDDRGFFFESFNERKLQEITGRHLRFVQDNHSRSKKNVLRGLHYQINQPQGKLVRAIVGEVFDVAVDIRRSSRTFGQWVSAVLSAQNNKQVWIPEGFAHGFLVLSDYAEVLYKATDYWAPEHERCIAWNDGNLGVKWPTAEPPTLSAKDRAGTALDIAELFN